jgi:hypothetical protein
MSDTAIILTILYLTGGAVWFFITLMNWRIDRAFPSLHSDEEIAAKARLVLRTPVWPLEILSMAGRAIADLQKDVMR